MNHYDAFSHSIQCDEFLSIPSPLIGGVVHVKCQCWCHNTEYLFSSPEPEYDLSPPPEYANSADLAFVLDEPAHVRVGFSSASLAFSDSVFSDSVFSERAATDRGAVVLDSRLNEIEARPIGSIDIFTGPANKAGFTNWSRQELRSGKCETCGDALADCECVE